MQETSSTLASTPSLATTLRHLVTLSKPRLSSTVIVTASGGLLLAPGHLGVAKSLLALVMTTLAVAAANILNCYLERGTDGLMKRTRARPSATGELDPRTVLLAGSVLAVVSVGTLSFFVQPLAGMLAAVAIVSYVAVYTPMKFRSPHAVIVGALPGAIPPLLGWVSVTGRIDPPGFALFTLLFVWQLPHFLAIALYLKEDYARAGIQVLPITHGDLAARICVAAYAVLLLPVALSLVRVHVAGTLYGVVATVTGVAFAAWAISGLWRGGEGKWARSTMLASVAHLLALFVALGLDAA